MKKLLLFIALSFAVQVWAQEEVVIKTELGNVYGTLLIPEGVERPVAVVFVSGSGPTDRDGNNPRMKNNSIRFLAEDLQKAGIASLRFDKIGIGKSRDTDIKEDNITIETFASEVAAWVDYLSRDGRSHTGP